MDIKEIPNARKKQTKKRIRWEMVVEKGKVK